MSGNRYLVAAAICCLLAALAHLGCIVFGGDWYRFLGAGEQMALMAEQGHWYPTIVTSVLVLVLLLWALWVISVIFLLRGLAFVFLMPMFPGNSLTFWWVSSAICLLIGALCAAGTVQSWRLLSNKPVAQ